MKIKSLSNKLSGETKALRGIKQEKPLIKRTKLNPYRVSRGRGIH